MRKRSGALHSDSEEQFMLLAELAHQKNGYFYDECLHKQIEGKMRGKIKRRDSIGQRGVSSNHFVGFDYAIQDIEEQEEMEELQAQNRSVQINIVIICPDQGLLHQKLEDLWPDSAKCVREQEQRDIDLYIVNIVDSNHHKHCFKFWLIEPQNIANPLFSSYLKRARKILNFTKGQVGYSERWPQEQAKGVLFSMVSAFTN